MAAASTGYYDAACEMLLHTGASSTELARMQQASKLLP